MPLILHWFVAHTCTCTWTDTPVDVFSIVLSLLNIKVCMQYNKHLFCIIICIISWYNNYYLTYSSRVASQTKQYRHFVSIHLNFVHKTILLPVFYIDAGVGLISHRGRETRPICLIHSLRCEYRLYVLDWTLIQLDVESKSSNANLLVVPAVRNRSDDLRALGETTGVAATKICTKTPLANFKHNEFGSSWY